MNPRRWRYALFAVLIVGLLITMGGCTPKDPFSDKKATETTMQPTQETFTAATVQVSTNAPTPPPTTAVATADSKQDKTITDFDVFYDATFAMMGFVDIPTSTANHYITAMDLLRNRTLFPSAQLRAYRVDHEAQDISTLAVDPAAIKDLIGHPSFYISDDMTSEPGNVILDGSSVPQKGRRLNHFLQSYYSLTGSDHSPDVQTETPVSYAVSKIRDGSLSVIVSDLSELNTDEATLVEQLRRHVFSKGMSFAIIGVKSEFAGFVPLKGLNKVWVQWGSLPSASPQKILKFREVDRNGKLGIAYDIPISSAEERRYVEQRPFYILCMGKTGLLNDYVGALTTQLKARGADCEKLVYANDYANHQNGFWVDDHKNVTEGVREIDDHPLTYQMIDTINEADRKERSITFHLGYSPLASDPRNGAFTPDDFSLSMEMVRLDENGNEGKPIPSVIESELKNVLSSGRSMDAVLRCPVNSIDVGMYRATITLHMAQPDISRFSGAFKSYIATSQVFSNSIEAFDGSCTFGLESFFHDLGEMQGIRNERIAIGSFSLTLDIRK